VRTEISGQSGFESVEVLLDPGETFVSEAGKMLRMSADIEIDVTTTSGDKGGILAGLGRLLGGGSFFLANYLCTGSRTGQLILAPTLVGQIEALDLSRGRRWRCVGSSYLASGPGIQVEPVWEGIRGMMSGDSMVFLDASGSGPLFVEAFGACWEVEVDGTYVVDTGHLVAFESSLDYEIGLQGGSLLDSFFSGEGLVTTFEGRGRLLIQSHNRNSFGARVGALLPKRER
jgi:uncharacterized protein (TIGR00266 family)